ncbi:MAG: phosphoribosylanthranilate isomerase [Thermodesulfobacteriota bacterium]
MQEMINPEVKICGITNYEDARICEKSGIDCIGFVYFKKSKRYITPEKTSEITKKLENISAAGVFVDSPVEEVIDTVKTAGLDTVQLHGKESYEYITRLKSLININVIKCLYVNDYPGINMISDYSGLCRGFIIEAEKKELPGGNGEKWDYSKLAGLSKDKRIIAAGGLNPENFKNAAEKSGCSAFDMSSGVEISPGKKNHEKIKIIAKLKQEIIINKTGRIFNEIITR